MKASELIEKLAQSIKDNGDCEIYTWNHNLLTYIPLEGMYFVDDSLFVEDMNDDEYIKDFQKIYHNIVIV